MGIIECIMQRAARLITSCLFPGPPTSFSLFPLQFLILCNYVSCAILHPLQFFTLCNFLSSALCYPPQFFCNFSSSAIFYPQPFFIIGDFLSIDICIAMWHICGSLKFGLGQPTKKRSGIVAVIGLQIKTCPLPRNSISVYFRHADCTKTTNPLEI